MKIPLPILEFFQKAATPRYILPCLIALGFVLRYYQITFQSYWYDELFSAYASAPDKTFSELLDILKRDIVHPFFYQILLWVWYKIIGYSDFSGRFLSCLISVMTIPALYFLSAKMFNKTIGIITASFATVNIALISYAQENRSYSLVVFLTVLSMFSFIKIIEEKRFSWLYALSTGLLINCHYYGYLILGVQGLIVLLDCIKNKRIHPHFIITYIIIALFTIPFLFQLTSLTGINSFWIPKPQVTFIIPYFYFYFPFHLLSGMFFFLCFMAFKKCDPYSKYLGWLPAFIFIPLAIVFLYSTFSSTSILEYRYTLIFLPFILILTSVGLIKIKDSTIICLIFLCLMSVSLFTLKNKQFYTEMHKEGWREALAYIIEHRNEEPVFSTDLNEWNVLQTWAGSHIPLVELEEAPEQVARLQKGERFWILNAHRSSPFKAIDDIPTTTVKKFALNGAYASLFEKQ